MNTKKFYLIILLGFIVIFLLFFYSESFKAKFITTYSKNYKEISFNNQLIGISETELLNKLGKPLKIYNDLEGYESFLYTKNLDEIEIAKGYIGVTYKIENLEKQNEIPFSLITFNKDNKCFSQRKTLFYKDTIDLTDKSKEDVIKLYGQPNRRMKCYGYKLYKYSKLNTNIIKNDSLNESMINVRLVYIDRDNKVVQIYKDINFDNNKYLGCCKYE